MVEAQLTKMSKKGWSSTNGEWKSVVKSLVDKTTVSDIPGMGKGRDAALDAAVMTAYDHNKAASQAIWKKEMLKSVKGKDWQARAADFAHSWNDAATDPSSYANILESSKFGMYG